MPKMEIILTLPLNVPVLHDVNRLMIQQGALLRSLGGITRRDQRANHLPRVDGHHASFLTTLGRHFVWSNGVSHPVQEPRQLGRA